MTTMKKTFGFLGVFAFAGAMSACIPPGESGQCSSDEDCTGRGTVCELTTSECIPVTKDYSSTAEPSPPLSFSDKAIPFFRGRICSAPNREVQTGSAVPITFQPCLHPCILSLLCLHPCEAREKMGFSAAKTSKSLKKSRAARAWSQPMTLKIEIPSPTTRKVKTPPK